MQRSLITFRSSRGSSGSRSSTSPHPFGAFLAVSKVGGGAARSTLFKDKTRNTIRGKEIDIQPPPPEDSGSDGDNEHESEDESDREGSTEYYPSTEGQGSDRSPPHVRNKHESAAVDMTGRAYRTVRPKPVQRRHLIGWHKDLDGPMPKNGKAVQEGLFGPSSSLVLRSDRPCRMNAAPAVHYREVENPKAACKPAKRVARLRRVAKKSARSKAKRVAEEAFGERNVPALKAECLITDCESCDDCASDYDSFTSGSSSGEVLDEECTGSKDPAGSPNNGVESRNKSGGANATVDNKYNDTDKGQHNRCQPSKEYQNLSQLHVVKAIDGPSTAVVGGRAQVGSIGLHQSETYNSSKVLSIYPPGLSLLGPLVRVENGLVSFNPKPKNKKRKLELEVDDTQSGQQAEPARKRVATGRKVRARGNSSNSPILIEGSTGEPQSITTPREVHKRMLPPNADEGSIITETHASLPKSFNAVHPHKRLVNEPAAQLLAAAIFRGNGYHIIGGGYANAGHLDYKESSPRGAIGELKELSNSTTNMDPKGDRKKSFRDGTL